MMNKAIQNSYKIEYNTKFQRVIIIGVMIDIKPVCETKPNRIIERLKEFIERLWHAQV